MKVTADEDKRRGAGQCVPLAPDVFDQREGDGIVVLLDASPPEPSRVVVREAAGVCPGGAIGPGEGL
ncbi:ferredoxin [Streptomyces sp. NPDC088341]|uniref:ferredoxin n=1 Tax=Streptomyces sp. NPDC088341 TaxID=3154870 RepID=UPI003447A0BA